MEVEDRRDRLGHESLLVNAVRLATEAHEGQRREDGSPYISHSLSTWAELCQAGLGDITTGATSLLHDVLEERVGEEEYWLGRMEREVSPGVAALIDHWLTEAPGMSKWECRQAQLQRFSHPNVPAAACHVKLASRIANLLNPSPRWHLIKRRYYAQHTRDLLASMRVVHPALQTRLNRILMRPNWK